MHSLTLRPAIGFLSFCLACGSSEETTSGAATGGGGATGTASVSSGPGSTSSSSTGSSSTGGSGPGDVIFFDDFEYDVGRSDANAVSLFQAAGWSWAKTEQAGNLGANGWLHTATSIPGFSGGLPGINSSRVLVIEARPFTEDGQTDFYLQLGDGESSAYDDFIPGDVWFQFWMYPQDSGTEQSAYLNRNKFFYVCNTAYPCHSHLWMLENTAFNSNPNNTFPLGYPSDGEFFFTVRRADGVSDIHYSLGPPDVASGIGQNDITEWMRPNRWTLVKMHFNTTSTTGNSWEMWLRPYGGAWLKVAEWIGGVTPGFTWDVPADSVGGHRVLRMPTTVGAFPGDEQYDYWLYMDDFTIATSERALPTYAD